MNEADYRPALPPQQAACTESELAERGAETQAVLVAAEGVEGEGSHRDTDDSVVLLSSVLAHCSLHLHESDQFQHVLGRDSRIHHDWIHLSADRVLYHGPRDRLYHHEDCLESWMLSSRSLASKLSGAVVEEEGMRRERSW